jgi:dethiobiotin synthetase
MTGGLFVSAIGTDCGKTHVSATILRELVRRNVQPVALKPLMSGFDPANLADSYAGRLLVAAGRAVNAETVAAVCWKSFPQWLAPNVAARQSDVALDWDELLRFIHDRRPATGPYMVEGAGGVMSPLTDTHTNLDLMMALQLPVLLVATNYLGAVSHTLTALDVMERRGLAVHSIVVSEPRPDPEGAAHMAGELRRWTAAPVSIASHSPSPDQARDWAAELTSRLFP